jgi:hypothetical protein
MAGDQIAFLLLFSQMRVGDHRRGKTRVINNSSHPTWNHHFTLFLEQGETVQAVLCEKAAIAFLKSKRVGQVDLSSLVQVSSTVKGMHAKAVQCLIEALQLHLDVVAGNGLATTSCCQSIFACARKEAMFTMLWVGREYKLQSLAWAAICCLSRNA